MSNDSRYILRYTDSTQVQEDKELLLSYHPYATFDVVFKDEDRLITFDPGKRDINEEALVKLKADQILEIDEIFTSITDITPS